MKYVVGESVIHRRNGLATITDLKVINNNEYYIVKTLSDDSETIYAPVNGADAIIRKIMSPEEADVVLKNLKGVLEVFNPNTKQRRDAFKKRLSSGDVNDIAYLYRQYYFYKRDPDNVKLGKSDVDMLEYAENMLLSELCITYNVDREEIESFISHKIV